MITKVALILIMLFQEDERDCSFSADIATAAAGAKIGKIGKTIVTIVNDQGIFSINIFI
jgi:hypothetical protein